MRFVICIVPAFGLKKLCVTQIFVCFCFLIRCMARLVEYRGALLFSFMPLFSSGMNASCDTYTSVTISSFLGLLCLIASHPAYLTSLFSPKGCAYENVIQYMSANDFDSSSTKLQQRRGYMAHSASLAPSVWCSCHTVSLNAQRMHNIPIIYVD